MTTSSSDEAFAFRDTELFALARAVSSHRVVVIAGSPGIGKSALAAAFARRKRRPGGGASELSLICRLEGARSAIDAVHEIARTLGVVTTATADADAIAERIGRALALRRRMLLILDDVDRCRAALAKLLTRWLRDAPTATFVVTTRGRLGVTGEHRLEIGPLGIPSSREKDPETIAKSPAAQLFARRAGAVRSGFRITASNARTVATIVRQLEGIPLAIELCASRMVALSERDIAELLGERLDLLEDDRGERSIRSAFALSWDELEKEDARLLATCSSFRGGFDLDAASAVMSAESPKDRVRIARSLERLVDASLVHVDDGEERRYELSETLRAYAAEKLPKAELPAVDAQHARHYAALRSRSPSLDVVFAERKNLEKAFERSLRIGDTIAASVLLSWAPVALSRGPLGLFVDRATRTLDELDLDPVDYAELRMTRGFALVFQGKRDEALDDFEVTRKTARKLQQSPSVKRIEALSTSRIALVRGLKGKIDAAIALFNEALGAATESGDERTQGIVRKDLANVLSEAGRNDEAVIELGRARKFLRSAGDVREEGFVLMMLGSRFVDDGRLAPARRDLSAALVLLRQAGDRRSEAWTLGMLALVDAEEGDASSARRQLDLALDLLRDVGDEHTEGLLLGYLGNIALEQGLHDDAETAYRDAALRLARAGDRGSEGLVTAAAAVVDYTLGRVPAARDGIARARELVSDDARVARRDAVAILASLIEPSTSVRSKKEGEAEEIRFARRIVAASARTSSTPVVLGMVVASDGSWIRTGIGDIAKLGAGRPIARVMHQLALERVRHPGRPVKPESIVRAGWPDERVLPAAAKNRLHVTIARLRRLALEGVLLHDDEGYFLDPRENMRLADPGELPR